MTSPMVNAPQHGVKTMIQQQRETYSAKVRTPFAVLGIRTSRNAVTAIEFLPQHERALAPSDALAERVVRQLESYLADPYFRFNLPLVPADTTFRQRLRAALAQIPV